MGTVRFLRSLSARISTCCFLCTQANVEELLLIKHWEYWVGMARYDMAWVKWETIHNTVDIYLDDKIFGPMRKEFRNGASLAVQWLGVCLPVQGARVRALVQEDPAWHGAAGPVRHNYWACALEPVSHNYWARAPQLLSLLSRAREPHLLSLHATTTEAHAPGACALQQERPPQWEACAPQQRVAPARCSWRGPTHSKDPTQPKKKGGGGKEFRNGRKHYELQ